jgi:hypothetical protein
MSAKAVQYTIRDVPPSVDRALRRRARERGTSLNRFVLEILAAGSGAGAEAPRHHDLDRFFRTWIRDPKVDRALAEERRLDARDWEP